MDNDEPLIPFANCNDCDDYVPVLFREFNFDKDTVMEVVVCPNCFNVLNFQDDVTIEYYDFEEVERLGYKVVREEEGSGEEG